MNKEPIIIVAGEPNSVFFEIFFKSIKNKRYKSPLIIIASKKLLEEQMKKLGFLFKIRTIEKSFNQFDILYNLQQIQEIFSFPIYQKEQLAHP